MQKVNVAVLTNDENDILNILKSDNRLNVQVMPIDVSYNYELDTYDIFFLLGGNSDIPVTLPLSCRNLLEAQIAKGKKVFSEFISSIGDQYFDGYKSTRFSRMIFTGTDSQINGLEFGDILEDQCNTRSIKFYSRPCKEVILISEEHLPYHSHAPVCRDYVQTVGKHTLWIENNDLMICTFRICNFIKACFSPKKSWRALVEYIIKWTTGLEISSRVIDDEYTHEPYDENKAFEEQAYIVLRRCVDWVKNSGLLINNGKNGMHEGYMTEITPDGKRTMKTPIRDDCMGEISMLLGMDYMLTGNKDSLEISDNLIDFIFREMQIKSGAFKGMLRWSDEAYTVAYTHDTGRAIFGELLKNLYLRRNRHMEEIRMALDFLIATSGSDGVRKRRTDITSLTEEKIKKMHSKPAFKLPNPDSDPNGDDCGADMYALAAMVLFYKITGEEKYIHWGKLGFEENKKTIRFYLFDSPNRFVTGFFAERLMPLAIYYHVTRNDEDKELLYAMAKELEKYRHTNGGYIEWYKGTNGVPSPAIEAEGSLLTENGVPIVDNLYNANWMSVGFIQAYLVTGDEYFLDLWRDIVKYYKNTQIVSKNSQINGAWARGNDRELGEIFGIPNDIGWGPWSIESGWTIGQIGSGIAIGLKAKELREFYLN
jgi:hypothetical protein